MYVRKLDSLGRIVIPPEYLESLGVEKEQPCALRMVGPGKLEITKHQPSCVLCGGLEDITYYNDKCICKKCVGNLQESE